MSKTLKEILPEPGTYKYAPRNSARGLMWIVVVHNNTTMVEKPSSLCSRVSLFRMMDGNMVGSQLADGSYLAIASIWEPLENFKFTLIINEDSTLC